MFYWLLELNFFNQVVKAAVRIIEVIDVKRLISESQFFRSEEIRFHLHEKDYWCKNLPAIENPSGLLTFSNATHKSSWTKKTNLNCIQSTNMMNKKQSISHKDSHSILTLHSHPETNKKKTLPNTRNETEMSYTVPL